MEVSKEIETKLYNMWAISYPKSLYQVWVSQLIEISEDRLIFAGRRDHRDRSYILKEIKDISEEEYLALIMRII